MYLPHPPALRSARTRLAPPSPSTTLTLAALAALAALCTPRLASANTAETSWTLSTTLDSNPDKAGTTVINLSECKDEIANGRDYTFTFKLASTAVPATGARYSIKLSANNQTCDKATLDASETDVCTLLVDPKTLSSSATITETINFADLTTITSADACDGLTSTTYIYLIVSETPLNSTTATIYSVSHKIEFKTTRPSVPTSLALTPGESTIEASWDAVDDADSYVLYYSTEPFDLDTPPEDQPSSVKTTKIATGTDGKITSLSVDTTYYVAVASSDADGNLSFFSNQETTTTVTVLDFWEAYSAANPNVDGGFCFIATAAYGSYQAPHVQLLRTFRDHYLLTHAPGRAFVDAYYALSPPLAHFIARHDTLRALTRAALWPLYAFAFTLIHGGPLALLALLLSLGACAWLARRAWLRRASLSPSLLSWARPAGSPARTLRAAWITTGILGLWLAVSAPNLAVAQYLPGGESHVNMVLEFKGGTNTPSKMGDTFDTYFPSASPFLFEVEFDWQLYRGIGSFALGMSAGYASVDGNGITESGASSPDTTSLSWMPLRLQLVYRFDWMATHWNFPLVPYGKLGLDYYVWWINDGTDSTATNANGSQGSGGTFGWNAVGGLSFLLDWLAPSMAKSFDMEWGVNNSYLFFEYMYVDAGGLWNSATALNLSSDSFLFGLAVEF
jgi:hypothetical protein